MKPPVSEPAPASGVIDVTEVKAKLDRGDQFTLIDVREPHEYQIARIPGAQLIPLGELPKRLNELDPSAEIVAHCKIGRTEPESRRLSKIARLPECA